MLTSSPKQIEGGWSFGLSTQRAYCHTSFEIFIRIYAVFFTQSYHL